MVDVKKRRQNKYYVRSGEAAYIHLIMRTRDGKVHEKIIGLTAFSTYGTTLLVNGWYRTGNKTGGYPLRGGGKPSLLTDGVQGN